jgi:hypothetical protein
MPAWFPEAATLKSMTAKNIFSFFSSLFFLDKIFSGKLFFTVYLEEKIICFFSPTSFPGNYLLVIKKILFSRVC